MHVVHVARKAIFCDTKEAGNHLVAVMFMVFEDVNAVHFEVHQHPKNKNTNQGHQDHQDKLSKTRTTIVMTIRVMAAMIPMIPVPTISWYKANGKQNPKQNLSAHSSNGEARGELPSQQKEVLMTFS